MSVRSSAVAAVSVVAAAVLGALVSARFVWRETDDAGGEEKGEAEKSGREEESLVTRLLGSSAGVRVRDENVVEYRLRLMKAGGKKKLKVFTDFDYTITSLYSVDKDGNRVCGSSSYGVLEQSTVLPESYRSQSLNLLHYYHPIEIDPSVNLKEKGEKMVEWWTKAHNLLLQHEFHQSFISKMIDEVIIDIREGCQEFLDFAHGCEVPIAIVSAGIAQVLEEILRKKYSNFNPERFHVVANQMLFDDDGNLIGWSDRLIHTVNKRTQLQLMEEDPHRKNLIVIGDHLHDSFMASHIDTDCQLRIGFLNRNVDKNLELYLDHFDIVILDDGPFWPILRILEFITG